MRTTNLIIFHAVDALRDCRVSFLTQTESYFLEQGLTQPPGHTESISTVPKTCR